MRLDSGATKPQREAHCEAGAVRLGDSFRPANSEFVLWAPLQSTMALVKQLAEELLDNNERFQQFVMCSFDDEADANQQLPRERCLKALVAVYELIAAGATTLHVCVTCLWLTPRGCSVATCREETDNKVRTVERTSHVCGCTALTRRDGAGHPSWPT